MVKETQFFNPGTLTFGFLAFFAFVWVWLPFLWISDTVLDLNIHDSYVVVGTEFTLMMIAISASIIALLYVLINGLRKGRTSRILTILHIITSLIGISGLVIIAVLQDSIALESTERRYYSYVENVEFETATDLMPIVVAFIIIGVIGQFLFVINLSISLINWLIKR